jgi:excisionase family DNA binding protein
MNSTRTEMDLRFPNRLLTPAQVAAALNVSKPFVYKLLRNCEIAVVRIGRSVRVLPSDLLAFIAQNTERNPKEVNDV